MAKKISILVLVLLAYSPVPAKAVSVAIGAAMTAHSSGQLNPGIHGALDFKNFAITGYSTGMATEAFFLNGYQAAFYWMFSPGDFLWGEFRAGFGIGVMYRKLGWRTNPNNANFIDIREDVNFGPAVRGVWYVAKPIFIAVEGVFGLKDIGNTIHFNFQDSSALIVGAAF